MNLNLVRENIDGEAVQGRLTVDGLFECFTLERKAVMIPVGQYPVELTYSPRFGRELPLIDNVPGREAIRIHPGNKPEDSEGCILVGASRTNGEVLESRVAESALTAKVRDALARKAQILIDVSWA